MDLARPLEGITSGLTLKLTRVVAHATATGVAVEMGVSRQRVTELEASLLPSAASAERYLAALQRIAERQARSRSVPVPGVAPVGARR